VVKKLFCRVETFFRKVFKAPPSTPPRTKPPAPPRKRYFDVAKPIGLTATVGPIPIPDDDLPLFNDAKESWINVVPEGLRPIDILMASQGDTVVLPLAGTKPSDLVTPYTRANPVYLHRYKVGSRGNVARLREQLTDLRVETFEVCVGAYSDDSQCYSLRCPIMDYGEPPSNFTLSWTLPWRDERHVLFSKEWRYSRTVQIASAILVVATVIPLTILGVGAALGAMINKRF
jgi:hypothetical protein